MPTNRKTKDQTPTATKLCNQLEVADQVRPVQGTCRRYPGSTPGGMAASTSECSALRSLVQGVLHQSTG